MTDLTLTFNAALWKYTGKATWYFITLPTEDAHQIRFFQTGPRRGWGAVKVMVSIGNSRWSTSIFPDKSSNSYILPVKAAIRKAESLKEKQDVEVTLEL